MQADMEVVEAAMARWSVPRMYLNFAEPSRDPSTLWSAAACERLRRVKAMFDPGDLIRSNHSVPLPTASPPDGTGR